MIECSCCNKEASFVLVNYQHEIIGEGNVFCLIHAFEEGREECPCCDNYDIEVFDEKSDRLINLLPTYPAGSLDKDGCCSEHP